MYLWILSLRLLGFNSVGVLYTLLFRGFGFGCVVCVSDCGYLVICGGGLFDVVVCR